MTTLFRCRAAAALLLVLSSFVLSVFPMAACAAQGQTQANVKPSAEESLRKFLQTLDDNKDTHYIAVFRDLNGDAIPEAIVYLVSSDWCGSGGCSMFILTQDGASWRVVTRTTITQPPIRVLTSTSNGWHNIGVWVEGGGIRKGYEAELRFNGKSYWKNPSTAPKLAGKQAGEAVIASIDGSKPLY
jgi:hypothetical protein